MPRSTNGVLASYSVSVFLLLVLLSGLPSSNAEMHSFKAMKPGVCEVPAWEVVNCEWDAANGTLIAPKSANSVSAGLQLSVPATVGTGFQLTIESHEHWMMGFNTQYQKGGEPTYPFYQSGNSHDGTIWTWNSLGNASTSCISLRRSEKSSLLKMTIVSGQKFQIEYDGKVCTGDYQDKNFIATSDQLFITYELLEGTNAKHGDGDAAGKAMFSDFKLINGGQSKSPLATDNLLENTDGVLRPVWGGRSIPSVFSRGGTLLPSIYADACYILLPSLFQRSSLRPYLATNNNNDNGRFHSNQYHHSNHTNNGHAANPANRTACKDLDNLQR